MGDIGEEQPEIEVLPLRPAEPRREPAPATEPAREPSTEPAPAPVREPAEPVPT